VVLNGARPNGAVRDWRGDRIVFLDGEAWRFGLQSAERVSGASASSDGAITAPMPGRVLSVAVKQGDRVKIGQALLVLEAMKMEHSLVAPFDGVVADLRVETGAQVSEGTDLARITGEE
jgi:3-methylcrotonyl-CoA carboxylase alpha subunit